jgi:hypothetical protein
VACSSGRTPVSPTHPASSHHLDAVDECVKKKQFGACRIAKPIDVPSIGTISEYELLGIFETEEIPRQIGIIRFQTPYSKVSSEVAECLKPDDRVTAQYVFTACSASSPPRECLQPRGPALTIEAGVLIGPSDPQPMLMTETGTLAVGSSEGGHLGTHVLRIKYPASLPFAAQEAMRAAAGEAKSVCVPAWARRSEAGRLLSNLLFIEEGETEQGWLPALELSVSDHKAFLSYLLRPERKAYIDALVRAGAQRQGDQLIGLEGIKLRVLLDFRGRAPTLAQIVTESTSAQPPSVEMQSAPPSSVTGDSSASQSDQQ